MSASILLSSNSFSNNDVIPVQYKNAINCLGLNYSPHFGWVLDGLVAGHIEYFNLYVENTNLIGTSPNGKFLHWGVTNIPNTELSIIENGTWIGPGENILPTDYGTGDRTNGWNGTCADEQYVFVAWVEAKIAPAYARFIFGSTIPDDLLLRSNQYRFLDRPTNLVSIPPANKCNTEFCPDGYTNVGDCGCIKRETLPVNPAYVSNIAIEAGSQTADYGFDGLVIYEEITNKNLPIGIFNNEMVDNNDVPLNIQINVAGSPFWGSGYPSEGRLNNIGVSNNSFKGNDKGFARVVTFTESTLIYIGVASDDVASLRIDGNSIFNSSGPGNLIRYKQWNIFPITICEGSHIIEMIGRDAGGTYHTAGFEIYEDRTVFQLASATDEITAGVTWNSRTAGLGTNFDIGNNINYVPCADGYALDLSGAPICVKRTVETPVLIICCWLIENCSNPVERFTVTLESSYKEDLFIDNIYTFTGNPMLVNNLTGKAKCFKIISKSLCEENEADIVGITVDTYYGIGACAACNDVVGFTSCDSGLTFNVTLADNLPPLVEGNVYKTTINDECMTFTGDNPKLPIHYEGVNIVTTYGSDNCQVCLGCLRFIDCNTNIEIVVSLAVGQAGLSNSDVNNLFKLGGHVDLADQCLRFLSFEDCLNVDYTDVTIDTSYGCTECSVCIPYYKLINCVTQAERHVYWGIGTNGDGFTIESGKCFTFDFDPGVCYTAQLDYPSCEVMVDPLYDDSNIVTKVDDCTECNEVCFKIIECETLNEFKPIDQAGISIYDGKLVQWIEEANPTVLRCGTVTAYRCLEDDGSIIDVTVLSVNGCYADCESCTRVTPPVEPEFIINHRAVESGINVPDCPASNTDCCRTDNCE
jgi:hypothetical protein